MLGKKIWMLITSFALGSIACAQNAHLISASFGIGNHNISASTLDVVSNSGMGIFDNLGYSFFLNGHWALHTGVGFKTFQSSSTLTKDYTLDAIDSDGESYMHITSFTALTEARKGVMLMFPVSVEYYRPVYSMMDMYASLGLEVCVPQQLTYEIASGQIETIGMYPQYNAELRDLPQHGFSKDLSNYTSDIKLTNSYSILLEFGGIFKLSNELGLGVVSYFTYGLNDILIPVNVPLYSMSGDYRGMITSNQTSAVNLVSYGVKMSLSWKIPIR